MEKFSKKMIYDYINGLDVEGYDIDDLENNPEFMTEVIKFSKDKRLYDLCGEAVKSNYEFIRYLVDTFSHDPSFISSVAHDYLARTNPDDITCKELICLMASKSGNREVDVFNVKALCMYVEMSIAIEAAKEDDKSLEREIGKGFIVVADEYASSDIIKSYFADKMIREIFFDDNMTFEEIIHKMVRNKSDLDRPNTFFVSTIEMQDSFLAAYAAAHTEVLEPERKELEKVKANWDKYETELKERKSEIFFQEVTSIFSEQEFKMRFTEVDVFEQFRKNPRYATLFIGYEDFPLVDDDVDEEIKKRIEALRAERLDETKMTPMELRVYKKIKLLAEELVKNDYIDSTTNDYDGFGPEGGNIIRIK